MLDKIPAVMIEPRLIIDANTVTNGVKLDFSDGSSKVVSCLGGGGIVTPTPVTVTVNGGQSANVTPSSNIAVRVQGAAAGTAIQWTGTGSSVSDPLITSLSSQAAASTGTDFTVNVPVGSAARTITFTATVGGQVVGTFSVTVAATAADFQLSASSALTFTYGSTTGQQAAISLTGIVGNPGTVSVTVSAGSAPVSVSPVSLSLSSTTTSGNVTVTPQASAASGTYSVSVTATNGTITRTATISVTIQAVSYATPTFQFLTEAGMPANEISLHTRFGLKITNIYKGSGVQLLLKGWNAGPAYPAGFDLDLTGLLTDPSFASYYDATTKTLTWPATDGWFVDLGWLLLTYTLLDSSGRVDQTITAGTMPLQVAVKAPDGVVRTSSVTNVVVKKAVSFTGTPLASDRNGWQFTGGQGGTMTYRVYAPKLAGQRVGFFWSTSAYTTAIDFGAIPAGGVLNYNMDYPAEFPDSYYTNLGPHGIIRLYTYTGSESSPTRSVLLGEQSTYTNPDGGAANVGPALQFSKRNSAAPIELRWYNGSTPVSNSASSGSYGPGVDPNIYQDHGVKVPRSAIGSTLSLQIKNLGITTTGSAQYMLSGRGFYVENMPSYNDLATSGSSSSGSIYWGVSKAAYSGNDITINLPMSVIDATFAQFGNPPEVGFTLWVGAYNPNIANFQHYLFAPIALIITR